MRLLRFRRYQSALGYSIARALGAAPGRLDLALCVLQGSNSEKNNDDSTSDGDSDTGSRCFEKSGSHVSTSILTQERARTQDLHLNHNKTMGLIQMTTTFVPLSISSIEFSIDLVNHSSCLNDLD